MTKRRSVSPLAGERAWIPVAPFRDERLRRADLRTLVALCSFANRRREAYPSHARIAEIAGLHVRTVRGSLERLRDCGYVEWRPFFKQGGRGGSVQGSNLYRIWFPDEAADDDVSPEERRSEYWHDRQIQEMER